MMFPRRYRSLLYKLIIIVPLAWLVVVMFFYSDKRGGAEENSAMKAPSGVGEKAGEAEPQVQQRPETKAAAGEETKEEGEESNQHRKEKEEESRILGNYLRVGKRKVWEKKKKLAEREKFQKLDEKG